MDDDALCNLFMFWYGFDKLRKDLHKYECTESTLRKQWDEVWFSKTKSIDDIIRNKFQHLIDSMQDYKPIGIQAKIGKMILYDQVPRNIFRGTGQAYQYDNIAKETAYDLLEHHKSNLPLFVLVSVILTLIHSEDIEDHENVLQLLHEDGLLPSPDKSGVVKTLHEIAKRHRERVQLFGRLPERAKIKQYCLTTDEQTFLNGLS